MSNVPDSPFDSAGDDGGNPDMGGASSVSPFDRLFDGDAPGPSVQELQGDYQMPQWMAVAARGVLRVATGSGVPPIFEILVGSVMGVMQNVGDENASDEERAPQVAGEGGL